MPRIITYSLHAVELPFRGKFEHAASSRETSSSLFLELMLDDGTRGWGEALPRTYVTGESRDSACALLAESILPHLIGMEFASFDDLIDFLVRCDGQAPADWVPLGIPQSAAWCAVDLALLDAFGKCFGRAPFGPPAPEPPAGFLYSGVLTSSRSWKQTAQLIAYRLLGYRALKLKVDDQSAPAEIARIRRFAGKRISLRADVNMGWSVTQALGKMPALAREGVRSFEQPLAADDFEGAARLVSETGLDVMADESLNTRRSLERLIETQACTAINARISKCGGLIATLARCREAREAGIWVQIGCQVGESSLLSAAHLHLCAEFAEMRHAEGCFGKLLLAEDCAAPLLQMRGGGCPPRLPVSPGLGVTIDPEIIAKHKVGHWQSETSST
jgi:L-alanine-DL-glutamate epimerase-like enolase superfamily enzyme